MKRPEWVAGMIDSQAISQGRLAAAITAACPAAWRWCDQAGSRVSRTLLTEALIASLPEALKLSWQECATRAQQAAPQVLPSPLVAEFCPYIEVLNGELDVLELPLRIQVEISPRDAGSLDYGNAKHVSLRLGVGHGPMSADFHELQRDLAPSIPVG